MAHKTVSHLVTSAAVLGSLFVLVNCGSGGGGGGSTTPGGGNVAKCAEKGLSVGTENGKATLKGGGSAKVTLVDVWATWCGPCKKSFPKIQDLNNKYKPLGLQVIAVSQDESSELAKIPPFMDATGAKFDVCWDENNTIANGFGGSGAKADNAGMPFSYVLDKKGVVRFSHTGYHDGEEEQVEKEIKQLLDEK